MPLIRAKQMAERLGLSLETIRRLARAGRVPCLQVNSRVWLFDEEAVLKALESKPQAASV